MATTTRVKQWGFGTSGHYTLADDATVAASVLSMTDPVLQLPWATHWDNEPGYDGNGNAVLAQNVTYKAHTGGADITMLDGELVMQAKLGVAQVDNWHTTIRGGQANPILALMTDSGLQLEASSLDADFTKFIDSTFREWTLRAIDGTATVEVADERGHTMFGVTDSAAAGTVTLKQTGAANAVILGGGSGGTEDQPYLAYRRQGTCELKAANAYTIPKGTTALGRLTLVADRLGGGTEPLDLGVQFKIVGGTGADTWTDLPADGDLSGESFTAGTSTLLWRLSTMDNANDCRYVPSVYAVVLTYEQTVASLNDGGQLKDVLKNIKATLNADATLMAYDGWSGVYVGWPDTMNFRFYKSCGCVIEWVKTPEEDQSNAREAGLLVWGKDESHSIQVRVAMRPTRTLEHSITGDGGLLDLTEDVLTVLRCETLSGTVKRVKVASREPSAEALESGGAPGESEDFLLMIDIEVEVQGKLITAVRP